MTDDDKPFVVKFGRIAGAYYTDLKTRAHREDGSEKTGSRELAAYTGVKNAVAEVIPKYAVDKRFGLRTKDGVKLNGIYRCRTGRLRICWIASSALNRAIVIFIGYRKQGDSKEVYQVLGRLLKAKKLDKLFEALEQKNPLLKSSKQKKKS